MIETIKVKCPNCSYTLALMDGLTRGVCLACHRMYEIRWKKKSKPPEKPKRGYA